MTIMLLFETTKYDENETP